MIKKLMKILAMGIMFVMVLSTFSACGEEEKKNDIKETESTSEKEQESSEKEKTDEITHQSLTYEGGVAILSNGEVYVNVSGARENVQEIFGEDMYQTMLESTNSYSDYQIEGYGDFEGWKLNVSNVKSIYSNSYGQDISDENPKYGIVMLHEDNTVSFASLKSLIEGNLDVVKLDAENIVEVVTIDDMGYTTYLVDADGNKTDVRDCIE